MSTGNIDYKAVLADLEARKLQLEAAIAGIKAMLGTGSQNGSSATRIPFGPPPGEPTNAERIAAVLNEAGTPLHLTDIRDRLKAKGKTMTEAVIRDVMTRKDKKRARFKMYGRGMFGLNDDH